MNRLPLLLSAAILLSAAGARAQDKATLDLLVKKGLITQTEADELVKTAAQKPAIVTAKDNAVTKMTVGGLIQARYSYIHRDAHNSGADPADINNFTARRVILNFEADFAGGWGAFVSPEMDGAPVGAGTAQNSALFYLDRFGIRQQNSAGTAVIGLRKVNFGLEEYGSAATAAAVERSVATNFSATNNFASRHTGLYWDGKIKDSGWIYGAALTNSQVNTSHPLETTNELAVWVNGAYSFTCPATEGQVQVGLNLGMINERGTLPPGPVSSLENYPLDSAVGVNPFVTWKLGKVSLTGEILAWQLQGDGNTPDVSTLGANLTAAYRATETIEPVVRLSRLDTDGLGISELGAVNGTTSARDFDHATSLYTGLNYRISGDQLKLQGGYEFTRLDHPLAGGSRLDDHALRVQIQAMF